jgi:hypothetical protein
MQNMQSSMQQHVNQYVKKHVKKYVRVYTNDFFSSEEPQPFQITINFFQMTLKQQLFSEEPQLSSEARHRIAIDCFR